MSTSVKITIGQYEAMIDRGDFDRREDHHVELIRGEIVPLFADDPSTPMNPPHASIVLRLTEWSYEVVPRELARIIVQSSVSIPNIDSVPQPDLAWVARKDYSKQHPMPADILLIIEVSDTTLAKDRGEKAQLYAEAGIRDYWIVNLQDEWIEVRRDPLGSIYQSVTTYQMSQEVQPLAFPNLSLPVIRLFEA